MNPQVVRELQRATASPAGDWRRGFSVLTVAVSAASAAALILFGIPEKDFKGRDHVFSGVQRAFRQRRDEFFGVDASSLKAQPKDVSNQPASNKAS